MRLRTKMPIVVGLTMACLFVLLMVIANFTMLSRAQDMENESAFSDAHHLGDALYSDLRQLDRTAQIFAAHSDTYRFMTDGDVGDIDVDLSDEALANLSLDFMVFLDRSGHAVRAQFMDLDLEVGIEPDRSVLGIIESESEFRLQKDPHAEVSGFLLFDKGVGLVAARPITTGDLYGAPRGTLVVGRYLGDWELDRLSGLVQRQVRVEPVDGTVPTRTEVARSSADATGPIAWWTPVDDKTLAAKVLVADLDGTPIAILRADMPRDVRAQGIDSMWYATASLLIIGVVTTLTVFLLVDRGVLSRLFRLSGQLGRLRDSGDITMRLDAEGADELTDLAGDINGMLAALEAAEKKLEAANEELERRVEERTTELTISEARYRRLLERMADAVLCVDLEGRVTLVNGRGADLAGSTRDELVGMQFADLVGDLMMGDGSAHVAGTPDPDIVRTFEAPFGRAGCEKVPVELRGTALVDETGRVSGTQWIVRDMTERKRLEQQLLHMASHDHLTGLRNRRSFEQALEMRLAEIRRGSGRGAIVWLDLDEFKEVNDTLGHRAGDEVLVMLAEQLRKHVRESSMLARLGGDEFAVLMTNVEEQEATAAAARILSAINAFTYVVDGHSVRLSASVGVVMYPKHGSTVGELLANADLAMYQAKERGRSRVHVHQVDDVWCEDIRSRVTWNERITEALDRDRFVLYGQPILDLRTNSVARHELLIRMLDDAGDMIMPAEFLPTAERLGLIHDIDRWVVREAVRILAGQRDVAWGIDMNLSGKAFGDPQLLRVIASAIEASGVEPKRLGFEITETAAIADITRAQELIAALKELGCRVSLDDFGSGFSSFYYLKHLAIDCLKVDGSFIRILPRSKQDQHLVRGMVEMCRGLGIEVVAEFVEDEDILLEVTDLGIDYAQGYYIGRPVPVTGTTTSGGVPTCPDS